MEQKKNNIVWIILLTLVICFLGGYIIYDKFISKPEENTKVEDNNNSKQEESALEDEYALSIGQMLYDKATDAMGELIGFKPYPIGWENGTCKDGNDCYDKLTNYDYFMDSIVSEKVKKAYEDANENITRVNDTVRFDKIVERSGNIVALKEKLELVSKSSSQIKFKLLERECDDYENYVANGVCNDKDIKVTASHDFTIVKKEDHWIIDDMPMLQQHLR